MNGYQPNGDTIYTMTTYDPTSNSWKKLFDYYKDHDGYKPYLATVLKNVYFPLQNTQSKTYPYYDSSSGTLTNFTINLPSYDTISNQVNGTYFLFSKEGVYTLKENEFPQPLVTSKIIYTGISPKAFVNKEKTFGVLIGGAGGIGNSPDIPYIQLIDLTSGKVTNLNTIVHPGISSVGIDGALFHETLNGVEIMDKSSTKILATINFLTQSIQF